MDNSEEYVRSYTFRVSEQETMFRDLFGKEETERKLKEQDGETDEW